MKHRVCAIGFFLLAATALLFFAAPVGAQAQDFDEYVLYVQPPDSNLEAAGTWSQVRHVLSEMQDQGLVRRFEIVRADKLVRFSAQPSGLHRLRALPWVSKVEQQTGHGWQEVYAAPGASIASPQAPLAPNLVSGLVDLPGGAPVEGMYVYAEEVSGWGYEWFTTNASGAYSLTLDSDGWWDLYLGDVPYSLSGSYAPPLDWKRQLNITSNIVQNFTLQPISSTITGTVRVTGTGALVSYQSVRGTRTDEGHDAYDSTDMNGLYSLGVTTGTYTVTLEAVTSSSYGYAPPFEYKGQLVPVSGPTVGNVDLWMTPLDKVITGTVTDKDSGQPIASAQLELERTDSLYRVYNIYTSGDPLTGTYSVSVTSGVYEISLDSYYLPSGYALPPTHVQTITVAAGNVSNVNFQLLPINKRIQGRVLDKDSGAPVIDVGMSIAPISGDCDPCTASTASPGGDYEFNVSEGVYEVELPSTAPSGYALPPTRTLRITVTASDTTVYAPDFVLLPKNKSLGGRVTLQNTSTGVDGVQMRLWTPEYTYLYTTTSGGGYYTFANVSEGEYEVYVNAVPAGYVKLDSTSREVEITSTNRSDIHFEVMAADKTIRGTVFEAGVGGMSGVDVHAYAYDSGYSYYPSTSTDASGAYTFTVPSGYFEIDVSVPGGYAGRNELRAPAGASGVDFSLEQKTQTIRGRVTDYAGSPVENVYVVAENYECYGTYYDYEGEDDYAYTDASGYYTLTVLPGNYQVSASLYSYPTPPYQAAQAGDTNVNFTMPQGFLIQGVVRMAGTGQGLDYVPVAIESTDECVSRRNRNTTSGTGGSYEATVEAGTYLVYLGWYHYDSPSARIVTVGPGWPAPTINFDLYLISGTVKYSDGQPVSDAEVYVTPGNQYAYVGSTFPGQYELYVTPGAYDIAADISNWPNPPTIKNLGVFTHTYNVNLTAPQAYEVSGTVRHSDGAPWENIGVNAEGISSSEDEESNTDANGNFTLYVRRGGTFKFYPDTWEYPANPAPTTLAVTQNMAGVDFTFGTAVTITGVVSETDAVHVPNIEVSVYGDGANGAYNSDYAYTFYDGSYVLFAAPGSYTGYAEWSYYSDERCYVRSDTRAFTLPQAGIANVDFSVAHKCGTILGRVTNIVWPICDAGVNIKYPNDDSLYTLYTADDWYGTAGIGRYRALVPEGTWRLTASKWGYEESQPASRVVTVTCGAIVGGQDFRLRGPMSPVSGTFGAAGGTLVYTSTQGQPTNIQVPAGALTQPTSLIYTPIGAPKQPISTSLNLAGNAFDLDAYRGDVPLPGFVLAGADPLVFTMNYSSQDIRGIGESSLKLYRWVAGLGWQEIGQQPGESQSLDTANNVLTVHLRSFSRFGNMGISMNSNIYLPIIIKNS